MGACGSNNKSGKTTVVQPEEEVQGEVWPMLLLGHTGVGKSTILKNVQILTRKKWSDEEKAEASEDTVCQLIGAFTVVLQDVVGHMSKEEADLREKYALLLEEVTLHTKESGEEIMFSPEGHFTAKPVFQRLLKLWDDAALKSAMKRCAASFHTAAPKYEEHLYHWMTEDHMKVFAKGTFQYTDDTILYYRTQTRGFSVYHFTAEQAGLTMVDDEYKNLSLMDVGGHLLERKFWAEHFVKAKTVLFIMALDDYHKCLIGSKDTALEEGVDENGKRVKTNLDITFNIFRELCGSEELNEADFVIIMNKVDAFTEKYSSKARKLKLSKWFPDYKGQNAQDGIEFIYDKFIKIHEESGRRKGQMQNQLPQYVTCATDHSSTKGILRSIMMNMMTVSLMYPSNKKY